MFGNPRKPLVIFGNVRKSSDIFGNWGNVGIKNRTHLTLEKLAGILNSSSSFMSQGFSFSFLAIADDLGRTGSWKGHHSKGAAG